MDRSVSTPLDHPKLLRILGLIFLRSGSIGVVSSSAKVYNAIDPNFLKIATGDYVLSFGSFWDDLYQVALNSNPITATGSAYNIAFNSSGTHAEEGSFIYWQSPFYYLFFSAGQCCGFTAGDLPATGTEYSVRVCRSTSATGGFVRLKCYI